MCYYVSDSVSDVCCDAEIWEAIVGAGLGCDVSTRE